MPHAKTSAEPACRPLLRTVADAVSRSRFSDGDRVTVGGLTTTLESPRGTTRNGIRRACRPVPRFVGVATMAPLIAGSTAWASAGDPLPGKAGTAGVWGL